MPLPKVNKFFLHACESKRAFASEQEANEELAKCRAAGRAERGAYRCVHCKAWHLTSQPWR
jgi:hypothetical protein